MKPKLIIMVGNIASGKTTWIKNYLAAKSTEELKNWIMLSKDDLRRMIGADKYIFNEKLEPIIHTSFINMLQNFMTCNISIIIDETNIDKETRQPFLHLTKNFHNEGYDYKTIAVVMPKITLLKSLHKKFGLLKDCFNWNKIRKNWEWIWKENDSKFETPTKEEGFNEIWKVDNENLLSWEIK